MIEFKSATEIRLYLELCYSIIWTYESEVPYVDW